MDREAIARLRRAFEAGFAASGEGWNGEHNTADSNTEFAEWISEAFASWYNETADAPALTPPPGAGGVEIEDVLQRLYRLAYIDGHSDAQYPDGDCDGPVIPVDGACISDGWRNCRPEFLNLFKEARHDG